MQCMKRVYKDKKGVGPLVSSQEKNDSRPGDEPRVNCCFCSRIRFKKDFAYSCFWRGVEATCLRCPGKYEGPLFPGQPILLAPSSSRPRPAVRRAPRPKLPVVCPGFSFDRFKKTNKHRHIFEHQGMKNACGPVHQPLINHGIPAGKLRVER